MPKGRGEFDREKVATKEVGELKQKVPGEEGVKQLRQCRE